jgi:hypothetical protein
MQIITAEILIENDFQFQLNTIQPNISVSVKRQKLDRRKRLPEPAGEAEHRLISL